MLLRRLTLPLAVFVVGALAFILYIEATSGRLPEHVTTHFGDGGALNSWMTRTNQIKLMMGIGLGFPLFLILAFVGVRARGGGLNIPHRDYWLAPERRMATHDFVLRQVVWFASFMLAFAAGEHYVILVVNASTPEAASVRLMWMIYVLLGYVAGAGFWAFWLIRHFVRRD
jgi:uncharacterized membrane protein YhfC